ncbi:HAD family hydrolase [Portibacter marinus]|uniref:HAD family hydrolase n=1 Tax=Portibacter marinus TaxID=2898660 RepID=UPI001F1FE58C|nr:HAD-IA family hydrolase [Portibacter marinus]
MIEEIIKQITPDIKALIFDLDGTLADTIPLHLQAWQEAGSQLGFHVTKEMILDHSGTPTIKVAEILGKEYHWTIDPETITEAKLANYKRIKIKHGKVQPIQPILKIAHQYRGKLPMGVGTGSTRSGALKSLEDIEAVDLFDIIVTASDVQNPKPHPETFMRSAQYFGFQPEECMVLEDGAAGIKAAKEGGFKLIDIREYL